MKSARFEEFRQVAYKYLGRAKDATFELTDAILLTRNVYSLAGIVQWRRLRAFTKKGNKLHNWVEMPYVSAKMQS